MPSVFDDHPKSLTRKSVDVLQPISSQCNAPRLPCVAPQASTRGRLTSVWLYLACCRTHSQSHPHLPGITTSYGLHISTTRINQFGSCEDPARLLVTMHIIGQPRSTSTPDEIKPDASNKAIGNMQQRFRNQVRLHLQYPQPKDHRLKRNPFFVFLTAECLMRPSRY